MFTYSNSQQPYTTDNSFSKCRKLKAMSEEITGRAINRLYEAEHGHGYMLRALKNDVTRSGAFNHHLLVSSNMAILYYTFVVVIRLKVLKGRIEAVRKGYF